MEDYLEELSDTGKPLAASKLPALSDLSPEEIQAFRGAWYGIDVQRRREVIHRLIELAEDNLDLDFDEVYRVGLEDDDGEVKVAALEGLWGSEDDSFIEAVIDLMHSDEVGVRTAASMTLGSYILRGELGNLSPEKTDLIEEALLDVFNDGEEDLEVRRRALEAVSSLSRPEVREAIRQAYASNQMAFRASALYGMGQNCDQGWLPVLLKEMRSPYPEMRFEAARASGELEAPEAVPRLMELVRDEDDQVRLSAIEALGEIGGEEAKDLLKELTRSPDEAVREAAEEALEEVRFWEDPSSL